MTLARAIIVARSGQKFDRVHLEAGEEAKILSVNSFCEEFSCEGVQRNWEMLGELCFFFKTGNINIFFLLPIGMIY